MAAFRGFLLGTRGMRRFGSAAIDLVRVACGRFDGFYEINLNAWDVSAGALIIQEAGGTVSDFSNTDNYVFGRQIVASNGKIHQQMLEILHEGGLK